MTSKLRVNVFFIFYLLNSLLAKTTKSPATAHDEPILEIECQANKRDTAEICKQFINLSKESEKKLSLLRTNEGEN